MKYFITNNSETYTMESSSKLDNPYEAALEHLGFKLDHKTDDGNVQEYKLLDKETNKPLFGLMEYMYERACFEALSSLGYSCDDELCDFTSAPTEAKVEEDEETEYVEVTNIFRFPLLGSKFGTNV